MVPYPHCSRFSGFVKIIFNKMNRMLENNCATSHSFCSSEDVSGGVAKSTAAKWRRLPIRKGIARSGANPMTLPKFKYHPDPVATGHLVESDTACACCGQVRGYIYTGPHRSRLRTTSLRQAALSVVHRRWSRSRSTRRQLHGRTRHWPWRIEGLCPSGCH